MTSSDLPNRIIQWLNIFDKNPKEQIPLFAGDYKILHNLAGVPYERIIRSSNGEPRVFIIEKHVAIELLKSRCGFVTKQEATQQLREVISDGPND